MFHIISLWKVGKLIMWKNKSVAKIGIVIQYKDASKVKVLKNHNQDKWNMNQGIF